MPIEPHHPDSSCDLLARSRFTQRAAIAWTLLACLGSETMAADSVLTPYAAVQSEFHSNVFSLTNREQAILQNGGPKRDDIILRYIAGVETKLPISGQKLHATAEGRYFDFLHFDRIDHKEYLLDGGLDWLLARTVDGKLGFRQERRLASFADRNTTQLTIERERIASASANVSITPSWRLETGLRNRDLTSPLPAFPEFELRETTARTELIYRAATPLSIGLAPEVLVGRFKGTPDARKFEQHSLNLTANYNISGLTDVGAELGYTQRREKGQAQNKNSAIIGALSYSRELSVKTKFDLRAFRRVQNYVGNAAAAKENGAGINLSWQATPKSSLTGSYQISQGQLQQTPLAANFGRRDDNQIASLKLLYQSLPWLGLRLYSGYQKRDSNTGQNSYDAIFTGAELQVRFD